MFVWQTGAFEKEKPLEKNDDREGEIVVQRKDIEASAQVTQLKTKSLDAGIRIPEY